MNLIIDVGNTLVKYAVFDGKNLLTDQQSDREGFVQNIKALFEIYPKIDNAIISSVVTLSDKIVKVLTLFCPVHLLSHTSKIPFKNSYASPETLGIDRIALATAAFYKYPSANVLVIDMGTCITYDMINDYGEYLGGAISPGADMRYRAMHNETDALPQLALSPILDTIGNTTESSMHSGVVNGITQELEGVIGQYQQRFSHLTVILTGGNAQFFAKRLKNSIFANSKFLLEGLNFLLEYNKN